MQFLNPVFGVSPASVDSVHSLGCVPEVGNHEAIIVSGIAGRVAYHFGFDDQSASVRPFPGGVARFSEQGFGLATLARPHSDLTHQPSGSLLQSGVSGYTDQVFDL